jgi:hypothetical protein
VVLFGCETWSLTLEETIYWLLVDEIKILDLYNLRQVSQPISILNKLYFPSSRLNFATVPRYIALPPSAIEPVSVWRHMEHVEEHPLCCDCRLWPLPPRRGAPFTYIGCGEGTPPPGSPPHQHLRPLHPRVLSISIMSPNRQTLKYSHLQWKKVTRHSLLLDRASCHGWQVAYPAVIYLTKVDRWTSSGVQTFSIRVLWYFSCVWGNSGHAVA